MRKVTLPIQSRNCEPRPTYQVRPGSAAWNQWEAAAERHANDGETLLAADICSDRIELSFGDANECQAEAKESVR